MHLQKIPVPSLTDLHRQNRIIFSKFISSFPPNFPPQIIITDESTVMVDLNKGDIWRKRGYYPPGSFYTLDTHSTSVMVWAGIGPGEYKTKLIQCPKRMNSEKYCEMIIQNKIVVNLNSKLINFDYKI